MTRHIISLIVGGTITMLTIIGALIGLQNGYDQGFYMIYENNNRDMVFSRDVTLKVKDDFTLATIAEELYDQKIISSKVLFIGQGIIYKYENKIVEGDYTISSNMSNLEILDLLSSEESENVAFYYPPSVKEYL
ncbi:hypothetical protein AN639_00745 [Candidatus Epulonipiscium fishelsonii]|uniref:Uncharacterized protein n=1 Tax=Candidatus Epulonipiscium fishelsonii TaxID=77094 RepID=A0ACC8X7Y4_9FIRM|nr:hypothetical protein AN396_12410 [Epulopiscium sp. SCG-B11WGA-EpuloA1]ONI41326.1 hypothetical protein AN639_00745 [Epulopiscium sp. SCG-B05WGA-EpuloA1]